VTSSGLGAPVRSVHRRESVPIAENRDLSRVYLEGFEGRHTVPSLLLSEVRLQRSAHGTDRVTCRPSAWTPNHLHRAKGTRCRLCGCPMALHQTQTAPQQPIEGIGRGCHLRKGSLPDRTDSNHERVERKGILLITTLTQVHSSFQARNLQGRQTTSGTSYALHRAQRLPMQATGVRWWDQLDQTAAASCTYVPTEGQREYQRASAKGASEAICLVRMACMRSENHGNHNVLTCQTVCFGTNVRDRVTKQTEAF
jgi:hypothetical protein